MMLLFGTPAIAQDAPTQGSGEATPEEKKDTETPDEAETSGDDAAADDAKEEGSEPEDPAASGETTEADTKGEAEAQESAEETDKGEEEDSAKEDTAQTETDAPAGDSDAQAADAAEEVVEQDTTWSALAAKASFSVDTYGIIVTNAVLNTGAVLPTIEAPIGAKMGSMLDDELPGQGSFSISARQSRVGVKAKAKWAEDASAEAKVELDLWGLHETQGPGTITQTTLRLRSAYMRIGDGGLKFLAGQNWTVVTPRLPKSYGHMAVALHTQAGAVWNRLPQLTLELESAFSDGLKGKAFFSVVRPHSGDGAKGLTRFDTQAPGPQSSLPWLQSRLALRSDKLEIGVAGHAGFERFEVAVGTETTPGYRYGELRTEDSDVLTWLVSMDAHAELGPLWFNGQVWVGQNLNGMFAHHGVLADTWDQDDVFAESALAGQLREVTPLQAWGGWAELGMKFGDSGWSAISSFGCETGPQDEVDHGKIHQNMGIFGALMWTPLSFMDISAEYLRSITYYRPNLENRENPSFRNDDDLLAGADPPARKKQGFNDSFSLNFRLRF
jgi:hypothetical protein